MTKPTSPPTPSKRLLSLDVLRGLTIAIMIMVNNNGGPGAWKQMEHSFWNGLTMTDLVFPTFLFVVGVSIVFSVEARLQRGATRAQLAKHTIQRAAVLFLLGIVVNGFPYFHLEHLRIYGVLQRIAICYLIVGLFYLWDRRVWTKIAVLAVTLVGYWVLVRWVPVPGAGVPGRNIPFLDRNQNIVAWTDRHLMPYHLYEDAPLHDARDPEGLLSDIPAVGTALLGLLTGIGLMGDADKRRKALGLVLGAAACLCVGYLWGVWFPINKKMWTSSYVLVSAGWSLAVFALAFWAIELKGWGKKEPGKAATWPWLVFGSNAIVAYMISELLPGALDMIHIPSGGKLVGPLIWARFHIFAHIPDIGWAAFAYSFSYMAICFIAVWVLYRRRIFVKV
ncbi:MAG TPA: heparan-alpha-glucosaminide N-acetyltransferase domain-containing protein [Terracidiphilus sp.]|nr:heparan-alpha-glucosaminide N-acetyltransferase domain-containing protein [Terracidiphilus sp.]